MTPRLAWALALGWMALITLLSHQSAVAGPASASGLPLADKLDHLAEFTLLGALLRNAVARYNPQPVVTPVLFVLALGASYGALDELHQSLVPGRSAELGDWLADTVGVALGSVAFSRYE